MEIKFVAFGIAKDILGAREQIIEIGGEHSVAAIKKFLRSTYPQFQKLRHFHIAVNEEYGDDELLVKSTDEVVIIPPVSGG